MKLSALLPTGFLLLLLAFAVSSIVHDAFTPAMAQDDDDGGNDDDGDDDGGNAGAGAAGSGNTGAGNDDDGRPSGGTGPASSPRRAPSQPVAVDLPRFALGELVTLALDDADLTVLLERGYAVLEERAVPELGVVSRRLSVPPGVSLDAARDEVRALASGSDADFNHFYRSEESTSDPECEGLNCASLDLIGWHAPASQPCLADVVVGVIDTGINPDHPTFATSRLEVHKLAPGNLDPSGAIHGTAVAALLIGDPASRSPGLLPGARVVAVDAFHSEGGDERADVFTLVAALDFLAAKNIRVVNLSLAGPPNSVLEQTVAKLAALDILLVAATGNVGPEADPAYPAAYPDVVAVTAVDKTGKVYRRAGRGGHVDLAAPGVDIWTAASIKGARPKTGTSFAAPFVSATAAAYLAADPTLTTTDLVGRLTASAVDLGDPGQDEIYGHGLVQAGPACTSAKAAMTP